MSIRSKNALYVLGLVWRGQQATRTLSTAVLHHPFAVDVAPVSESRTDSFLESETTEYQSIGSTLPPRSNIPKPIPWPTLFPDPAQAVASPTVSSKITTPPLVRKPCDLLSSLVASNRLSAARTVHSELVSLHTPIQHRFIYLDAALASLDGAEKGKEEFLFWMTLYPNRPATVSHPGLKQIWLPVVSRLVNEYPSDTDFLASFLHVSAQKGLLPVVLSPIMTHLVLLAPPVRSRSILESAVREYELATTSVDSSTERAQWQRTIVGPQIQSWWKQYVRGLAMAGYKAEAKALFDSPPRGVTFDAGSFTYKLVSEELGHVRLPYNRTISSNRDLPFHPCL
ncbi:hypothetical protein P7C73_g4115, partial [Tremellales sp. Uapishka_1]